MAIKTFWILATLAVTPNFWGNLQDGGSAPTAASTSYGWKPAKTALTTPFFQALIGANATSTTASASSTIDSKTGPTKGISAGTSGDSFISPLAYSGTFAATAWTFAWNMRAGTSGAVGQLRMRVWASVNADGSSARELTSSTQVGSIITLSTTADTNSSISWSPGAITLSNEFLFFQLEWKETTQGSGSTSNVLFRAGTASITTPDFALTTAALIAASSIQAASRQLLTGAVGLVGNSSTLSAITSTLNRVMALPASALPAVIASLTVIAALPLQPQLSQALQATSAAVKAFAQASGKFALALTARAAETVTARSQPSGKTTLSSQSAAVAAATSSLIGKAAVFGRAFSTAFAKSAAAAKVGLTGRGQAASAVRGTILNTLQLAGKGFSRTALSATAKLVAALTLKSSSVSAARESVSGQAPLNSRTTSKASAFASASAKAGLLARAASDLFARAQHSLALSLSAKTSTTSAAKGSMSGSLAMAARSAAASVARGVLTLPGQVLLIASGSLQVLARGATKAAAALRINSSATSRATATPSGILHLLGRSAAVAKSIAAVSTQQIIFLLARGFGKVTTALTGKYAAAVTASGVSNTRSSSAMRGKVGLAVFGKLVGTSKNALAGSLRLATRAASLTKGAVAPTATLLLAVASHALAIAKASARYVLALSTNTLSSAQASGAPPSMSLVLRALSSMVTGSRSATSAFHNLIRLFARSAAATFATLGNRALAILGRPVSGLVGDSVSGTAGDNVSGSGGSETVSGSGP